MIRTSNLRRGAGALGLVAAGAILLTWPDRPPRVADAPAGAESFRWDRDGYWAELHGRFVDRTAEGCDTALPELADGRAAVDATLRRLSATGTGPSAPVLDTLERAFFEMAPLVAACGEELEAYAALQSRMRGTIKHASREWDMTTVGARARIYRALYGSRGALEEVMLHHPGRTAAVVSGTAEPSSTPSAVIEGVLVHSGDLLVSRGGYPTSALIARGSDFPGNFSHIALVHVDSSGTASVVEAHIERGVAISTADEYLRDKKRRILVLRPRADLPALRDDPMLPHRAASRMLARATSERIPYDFTMDYQDPSRLFCSEVASAAYRQEGVTLWTGLSTISAPGLRRWLASFGVRHFETQEPSDLEYDPQLVVVAEWRDPETLAADHIDNAVIDAMLEGADAGDDLRYAWHRLPPARLAKGYSWLLNRADRIGPVPEGMSATAALRNQAFSARQRALAEEVTDRAARWQREHGYPPPYWMLLDLARRALAIAGAASGRAAD
jgi:hypothetical protein